MNIVVLAGGTSTERDVSINTSMMVCQSLRNNGHNANMIDVFLGSEDYDGADAFFNTKSDLEKLAAQLTAASSKVPQIAAKRKEDGTGFFGPNVLAYCKAADIVFIGLHGANGEDGRIQGMFDLLDIKYTGTDYLSSAISMDKNITKKILVSEGVPMPKGVTLKKGHKIEYVPLPCVVKPCCGGSSVGVTIVKEENNFKAAVEDAFKYEDEILVEEFVKGREFSIAVINGKALPIVEIEAEDGVYDYENKYNGLTKETCPAQNLSDEIADQMQRWAERACAAAGVTTYARVDELLDEQNRIFCLEINTLPGMTKTSLIPQEAAAIGVSYDELTQMIIDISMKKYN